MTTSVTRKSAAPLIMNPRPFVAATSSAATSVAQPAPSPMRVPVRMLGVAWGRRTKSTTWVRVAPSDRAALTRSCDTDLKPSLVAITIDGRMPRKMTRIFANSPMPNQMMTSGR